MPLARKVASQAARRYRQDFDVVHSDALLGLVLAAERCESEATFGGYAKRYMAGHILHGIRDRMGFRAVRARGDQPPVVVSLDGETVADPTPGPVEAAERAELWAHVDRLPDRQRVIVRGYYQFGFSQDELAAICGVSQAEVSRVLVRARERLGRCLENPRRR